MKYAKPELGDLDKKACSAFHSLSFVDRLNCFFHDIQRYFIQTCSFFRASVTNVKTSNFVNFKFDETKRIILFFQTAMKNPQTRVIFVGTTL